MLQVSVSNCAEEVFESEQANCSKHLQWQLALLQILLSVIAVFYITTAIISLLPASPIKSKAMLPVKVVWDYFAFRQNWSLFGPEVRDINFHMTAIVTLSDGNVRVWEAPRMDKVSMWTRFRKEKWRKWGNDILPWPDYKPYWADCARYIARLCNIPGNPPVQVSFNLHWVKIPPPESGVSCASLPEHNLFNTIYVYRVAAEDLR